MGLHNHAIAESQALIDRNCRLECFPVQRRKPEDFTGAIMLHDKLHRFMTQSAMPIVEENVRGLRERRHNAQPLYRVDMGCPDFPVRDAVMTDRPWVGTPGVEE